MTRIMLLGIILLIVLTSAAMKWQKPILASATYSLVKIAIQSVFIFILRQAEYTVAAKIIGMLFSLVVSFLVAWLMTWLLVRFRDSAWAIVASVPLAVILLFF